MEKTLISLDVFNRDPFFRDARNIVAERVRTMPKADLEFGDSLQEELVNNAQAGFIYPVLMNTPEAEEEGLLEVRLRALMNFEKGALLTLLNGEKPDLEYTFDPDQSTVLMETLAAEHFASVVRYAYSKRADELYRKIRQGKNGMLEVQRRLQRLETHCRNFMEIILGENEDEEQE